MIRSIIALTIGLLRPYRWVAPIVPVYTLLTWWAIANVIAPIQDTMLRSLLGITALMPAVYLLGYALAVFASAQDVDLTKPGCCLSPFLLRLPVHSTALALTPIALSALFCSLWWWLFRELARPLVPVNLPLIWPMAVLAATAVAAMSMVWWPFQSAFGRFVFGVYPAALPGASAWLALQRNWSEEAILALLLAEWSIFAILAVVGLGVARVGRTTGFEWPGRLMEKLLRRGDAGSARRFESSWSALVWFEWRRFGWQLPILTFATLGLIQLILLFLPVQPIQRQIGFLTWWSTAMLGMVMLFGATIGYTSDGVRMSSMARGVPPFLAIRPVRSADLARAQFTAIALSVALTLAILAGLSAVNLARFASRGMLERWWRINEQALGRTGFIAAAVGLPLMTALLAWRNAIWNVVSNLTCRKWIITVNALSLPVLIGFAVLFMTRGGSLSPASLASGWKSPGLMVALLLKFGVAAALLQWARRTGVLRERELARVMTIWLLAVLAFAGLAWIALPRQSDWAMLPGLRFDRFEIAAVVMLLVPICRWLAGPIIAEHARRE